jgi:hypothetical protein
LERKKKRMREEEEVKNTRIKCFLENFKNVSVAERMKIESELIEEYKGIKIKIGELKQ